MSATTKSDGRKPASKAPEKFQLRIRDLLLGTLWIAVLMGAIVEQNVILFALWAGSILAFAGYRTVVRRRYAVIDLLIVIANAGILVAVLLPSLDHPESARELVCRENLKQIGVALQAYHDTYKCFPPAYIADNSGKPMHSWRVLILPFLDRKGIYGQYRFDEPWDGPSNRKLADKMAAVDSPFTGYMCPEDHLKDRRSQETSYVVVVGPGTAWPGSTSARLPDFKDGAGNVILVVETYHSGIHWMEPRDFHVTQMDLAVNPPRGQGISGRHGKETVRAWALYADGSVRYLSAAADLKAIDSRLRINDGTIIDYTLD